MECEEFVSAGPWVVWEFEGMTCRLVSNRLFDSLAAAQEHCDGLVSLAAKPISYTPVGAKPESLVVLDQLRKAVRGLRGQKE